MSASSVRVVFLDASSLPRGLTFPVESGIDYQAFESTSADQVSDRIADATVVITNKVRLNSAQLQAARHLQLVGVAAAGTDNVDLEAAKRLGIQVRNVPDYGSDSVAEHAVATLFALRRELLIYAAAAKDGRWRASPHFCWTGPPIRDVGGTVFGVIGRGRIGEAVARLARGLGMEVLFAETPGFERKHDELPLDELLARSDAVTLHLPLTPETKGLIGSRTLALMKPTAVLINTGRGALVDATGLADALRRGVIAGAAIDVLDVEPPPADHPLLTEDIPHLLLTPHVAWASDNAQARLAQRLVEMVLETRDASPR
jgi:glycerate dehydrogenase